MMDEQDFKRRADQALNSLYNDLISASDDDSFEADYGGALTVEFEDPPAKFVISPNTPVRQIWVSAHSKSYKLDWDPSKSTFVLLNSGQSLKELLQAAVSQQLHKEIHL
jgi:iron donor protein CyaY